LSLYLAGAAVLSLALTASGAAEPSGCPVPNDSMDVLVRLPRLAARLHTGGPVTIVAIGGGSTVGAAAGAPDLAYPHRLQVALAAFYPDVPLTVINKGVPRQSAQEMVARFPADVMALEPSLVVWEVGISDAVRGIEIDDFANSLQAGIDELKKRAIDILLVDMQFSRRVSTILHFERYLHALHRVGELNEVYVFPRFALMRYWSEQNDFNFDDVADSERARLAAKVYDCIGKDLAEAIRIAVR
jgi:hypothetical protein